jgi:hypothetical protein
MLKPPLSELLPFLLVKESFSLLLLEGEKKSVMAVFPRYC